MTAPPDTTGEQALRAAELAAALRATAERYRDLFERNLAGVYRSTPDGRLLEVNPAFARAFGYASPEELQEVPATALYLDPRMREEILARLRADGALQAGELRMRRRDGTPVWVIYSEQLRVVEDGTELIEGTLLDVTAHKEAEERALQAGRLAAVGTLAAGVAHEVSSPLAGVLANLGYALEALPGLAAALPPASAQREAAAELEAALRDAREAAERVRDTVRYLRLFARAEDEPRAALDLARVLDAALALLTPALRRRARLVRAFQEAPRVLANEARLAQAFLNLLVHALQSLPDGAPEVHTLRVGLGRTPEGDARVEISDDGAGLAQEKLSRAFDPFSAGPAGTGHGLGLPAARAIFTSLGGSLLLDSTPGGGTVAQVVLPAAVPGAAAAPAAEDRTRLLVIEAEPEVGRSLARLLPDHEVSVVASGGEAQARLEAGQRFDVILCDLDTPDLAGEALHQALAARWPELARRVVFTATGKLDAARRAAVTRTGRPLVDRPFDLAQLASALAAAARG
ncbi:MAG: ATP-binding protein [Anaeromyxobacter sp.]